MSGPHCPDCRCFVFLKQGSLDQCRTCGWVGDLSLEPNRRYVQTAMEGFMQRYRDAQAGKYFTVRVLCTKEQENDAAEIMRKIFDSTYMNTKDVGDKIELRISRTVAPTKEQVDLIARTGKVSVFPEVKR